MKKILLIACAMAMSVVANASTVSWSASSMTDILGTSLKDSTLKPLTAVATFYSSDGTTVLATSDGTLNALGTISGKWTGAATGTQYYAKMIITDKNGNTIESGLAEFSTSGSATYTINFANGTGFADKTNKFDGATWTAAPEPTSGLLLLLGMAGLALKRKRA